MKKILLLVCFTVIFYACDSADYDEVNKIGKVGVGEVLKVEDTKVTINDNPRVEITVKIYTKDGAPFESKFTNTVSRVEIPRRGDHLALKFDPNDKTKVIFLQQEDVDKVKAELDEISANMNRGG